MASIYEEYKSIFEKYSSWFRFRKESILSDFEFDTLFEPQNSNNFIRYMFFQDRYLKLINKVDYPERREIHTVSAFFMGIMLKERLNISVRIIPRICGDYHQSFLFFWSMICLSHDLTYGLESNSDIVVNCPTLDDFVKYQGIRYNLLEETEYSELFRNYYRYRHDDPMSKRGARIDHGITCGIILYDILMQKYYEDKNIAEEAVFSTIDKWRFNNKFKKHAVKIAETIARHNLWRANDKTRKYYEKYNLHNLINTDDKSSRVSYSEKDSLLFLLGLVDSLEPFKCCNRTNNIDVYELLNNVEINFNSKNKSFSVASRLYFNPNMINTWKDMENWLDLETESMKDTTGIKVSFRYERADENPLVA